MVKKQGNAERKPKQAEKLDDGRETERVVKITAETPYGECSERLTAFGGLLALVKFMDLIQFETVFKKHYAHPNREPKLGGYRMLLGLLMLLFIGFQRVGQFVYIRTDAMLCGIMRVTSLPVVSTFWRYLRSMGIVQSGSILRLNGVLRGTVWELCAYRPQQVTVHIDTTVTRLYPLAGKDGLFLIFWIKGLPHIFSLALRFGAVAARAA